MHHRFRSLISIMAALLAVIVLTGPVFAQDATPTTDEDIVTTSDTLRPWVVTDPFTPQPDECIVDPLDLSRIATSLATPIPVTAANVTTHGLTELSVTGLADAATVAGVIDTLGLFWACTNAGNRPAVASLMTPAAIAQFYGIDLSLTGDELDEIVAAKVADSGDREEENWASIDGVLTIEYLGDGRTGALVLNTDPLVNAGESVLDLFVFVNLNGVYQVDSVVFDPFDLTPGYGYER